MLRFQFSDVNWTNSANETILMSLSNDFYIKGRLTAHYIPTVITEDTWKGKTFPVQINQWEAYKIMIAQKEFGIHLINKIQACKTITITDTETSDSISVDTSVSDGFSVEPGERYLTSNQSFSIILKTKKISTYPAMNRNSTYYLRIIRDGVTRNYYTDHSISIIQTDVESANYSYDSGQIFTGKTVSKLQLKMIFYLFETDARQLKYYVENIGYTSVSVNGTAAIEVGSVAITELTEGLFRCETTHTTFIDTNYA